LTGSRRRRSTARINVVTFQQAILRQVTAGIMVPQTSGSVYLL
jgi:hypothetical protein